MVQTPFQLPTGLVADDTTFSAPGRWKDAQMARFYEANWQIRQGWEALMLELLGGVCRTVFAWTDTLSTLNIAFGTHATLEVWQAGAHVDITPALEFLPVTLAANPLTTTNASAVVQVNQPGHPYQVGQSVTITGAVAVGGITPNGAFQITATTVTTWSFNFSSNATSTATGGGSAVVVQNTLSWQPGQIDGTGGAGYGTGAYGVGTFGTPSLTDYFPLTWSLGAFGAWLVANPRGKTIFYWQNNLAAKAIPVPNAPVQVTYMLSVPQRQVMAFGCNEELSKVFNPLCIRFSDTEDLTVWTTLPSNNAGEVILPGGGRIVCARVIGNYVFCWTETSLYLGTFIGAPDQTWRFDKVADNCGSISPGGPIVKGQLATWISPDQQFYACALGGAPNIIPCPIRSDFANNITAGQNDKIVGGTISTFGELTWFYPDRRDGLENSRDITVSQQGWCRGRLSRTAWVDSGPQPYPVGCSPDKHAYWQEKGASQDGAVLTGFIESCDFYLSEAAGGVMVNGVAPDFRGQIGVLQLTIFTREYAQAPERQYGPISLPPGLGQRSFRVAGRIARLRYDWSSAPCYARAGRQEFDVEAIGGR